MPIPDYETIMNPIMEFLKDGQEKSAKEIIAEMVRVFELNQEDIKALIPSGRGKLLNNRAGWACGRPGLATDFDVMHPLHGH